MIYKFKKIIWKEEQENIVKYIVSELGSEAILKFPNFGKNFPLQTDASDCGIGAVLYQEHGIIGYYSKKLTASERNYL